MVLDQRRASDHLHGAAIPAFVRLARVCKRSLAFVEGRAVGAN